MSAEPIAAASIADAISDRSAAGIAGALNRLISSGRLASGDRLPTVRELAASLGTSPATVAEAWRALTAAGAIVARGRAGTYVLATARPVARYDQLPTSAPVSVDLSTGVPDPALLPDLGPALTRVARRAATSSYLDEPVLPELAELLRADWPYPVDALTVVDGALDGIDRVLRNLVRLGDHVAVENPCFPPILDMLDRLGAVVVPMALDVHGVRPESLAAALDSSPVAVVLQPRAQNPTGASMSPARVRALARVLRSAVSPVTVVEDNHSGSISAAADVSLGSHLPDRTVHVRSYSKSHGPDLRIAALGGPRALVDELVTERHLGPGWTSRLVQGVLADLLLDPAVHRAVGTARTRYVARRERLVTALASHGVRVRPGDGLSVWLPVADERYAMVTLAAAGVGATPGAVFACAPIAPHVRVTLGTMTDSPAEIDALAAALAQSAARPSGVVRPMRTPTRRRAVGAAR